MISPKVQLLTQYQDLFAHKQWEAEIKQLFCWLDSERNSKLSGGELYDFVLLFGTMFSKCVDRKFDETSDMIDEYFDQTFRGWRLRLKKLRAQIIVKTLMPLLRLAESRETNTNDRMERTIQWYRDKKFSPVQKFERPERLTEDYLNEVAKRIYLDDFLVVLHKHFIAIYTDSLTKTQLLKLEQCLEKEKSPSSSKIKRHQSQTVLQALSPKRFLSRRSSSHSRFTQSRSRLTKITSNSFVSVIVNHIQRATGDNDGKFKELLCRYVVLEREAREPYFHPTFTHITHSCHLHYS